MAVMTRERNAAAVARRTEGRYLPLSQVIDRLFQESFLPQSLFDGFGRLTGPTGTNLWETGDRYIVEMAMPGVKPDSISCQIEENILTCSAESAVQAPKDATPVWETFGDRIEYCIQLPAGIEPSQAEAAYEHGVLTITVPKAEHVRARPIKVEVR
jgi:HSP20 family protein